MGNAFDLRMYGLARRQHGVIARDQLLEIGTRRQVDRRVADGVLERRFRAAYVFAGAPRTWKQDLLAACFAGGKGSVASHRAAAALWHMPGGAPVLEVTSPRWRRTRHDGVVPHESRHLTDRDITYAENIPVTRPARTIVDLGYQATTGEITQRELERVLHDAIRRDLVDLAQVWTEWERLGGAFRPGGVVTGAILQSFVPPLRKPDSTPEIKLLQLIRAASLPEPVPQYRVWLSATKWFDLDYAWPEHKAYAEFDPYRWHGDRDRYEQDTRRRLELRTRGWEGVSVTDRELDSGAPLALQVLGELLEGRAA